MSGARVIITAKPFPVEVRVCDGESNLFLVTKAELAQAFDEWARRYDADPESFQAGDTGDGYGADCATYLIGLLQQVTR